MAGKFDIYTDKSGEHRCRLKSGNGQNILSSEGYNDKAGCKNGIESVRKNAKNDGHYERTTTTTGKFRFSLRAGNNQIIGMSQSYESEFSRENGIEAVKSNAPTAVIEEE